MYKKRDIKRTSGVFFLHLQSIKMWKYKLVIRFNGIKILFVVINDSGGPQATVRDSESPDRSNMAAPGEALNCQDFSMFQVLKAKLSF